MIQLCCNMMSILHHSTENIKNTIDKAYNILECTAYSRKYR